MTPKSAKKTLLLSMILSAAIITVASARKGNLPPPRRYIGMGSAFLFCAILVEALPGLGAGLALLIATAVLLKNGEAFFDAILGAQGSTRAFAQSRASVVPTFNLPSLFGGPVPIGEWGSAKKMVQSITRPVIAKGWVRVGSSKRATRNTSTGGVSDHWTGCKQCYAEDLFGTVANMDKAAIAIAASLGKNYDGRSALNLTVTREGYRVQVLYRTLVGGDHFKHIHVGARREGYTP